MSDLKELYSALRVIYRTRESFMRMRVEAGNRLVAYFYREVVGIKPGCQIAIDPEADESMTTEDDNGLAEGKTKKISLLDKIIMEYNDLRANTVVDVLQTEDKQQKTGKITRKKKEEITEDNFKPGEYLRTMVQVTLVRNYLGLVEQEKQQEKFLQDVLNHFPMYDYWKNNIRGVSTVLSAFMLSEFDIYRIEKPSYLIAYCGLHAVDGRAVDTKGKNWRTRCLRFSIRKEVKGITEPTLYAQASARGKQYDVVFTVMDNRNTVSTRIGRFDPWMGDEIPSPIPFGADKKIYTDMIQLVKVDDEWNQIVMRVKDPEEADGYAMIPTGVLVTSNVPVSELECQASLLHSPKAQSKMIGVLFSSLMRMNPKYREMYDGFKRRYLNQPLTLSRLRGCPSAMPGKKYNPEANGWRSDEDIPDEVKKELTKQMKQGASKNGELVGKAHSAARRKTLRQFLINDVYLHWRQSEGLPTTVSYEEGVLGIKHGTLDHHVKVDNDGNRIPPGMDEFGD